GHDEAEAHEGEPRAHPGQKRALEGEVVGEFVSLRHSRVIPSDDRASSSYESARHGRSRPGARSRVRVRTDFQNSGTHFGALPRPNDGSTRPAVSRLKTTRGQLHTALRYSRHFVQEGV